MNSKSDHDDAVSMKVQRSCSVLNYIFYHAAFVLFLYLNETVPGNTEV